jgi:aspartyl-tRNA synthetase
MRKYCVWKYSNIKTDIASTWERTRTVTATEPSPAIPTTQPTELTWKTPQKRWSDSPDIRYHHCMTSVTDYFTDNSTDYMYGETFYGRHTAQIALLLSVRREPQR